MNGRVDRLAEKAGWLAAARTAARVIVFRVSQAELVELNGRHLTIGLACAWLVGIGRYWDNPRVGLLQHLGIGSVVYVFVLSCFLWLIIWPLRPRHWSYFRVLTFVSLVSPPAVLYAIPVEKFISLDAANEINALFLAIVASWRVALLVFFLRRLGELGGFSITVATTLPLTLIVVTLSILNLDKVVFNLMGGRIDPSPNDAAYGVLILLSWLSILLFIPLVVCYLVLIVERLVRARQVLSPKNDEK